MQIRCRYDAHFSLENDHETWKGCKSFNTSHKRKEKCRDYHHYYMMKIKNKDISCF